MGNKGVLRRPFTLIAVAAALIAVAISLPLQVMVLYGHGFSELSQVFHKLTSLNYLTVAGCVLAGVLVYQASVFARFAVPALLFIVAVNNFFVGYFATDFSFLTASMATLVFGALLTPLYMGEVRELFLHPERRWWRSKARIALSLPVFVGDSEHKVNGETYDISETGLFMRLSGEDLAVDGTVNICLTLGELRQIRCNAKVVRRSPAKGSYPAGVGLQFTDLHWRQRRELKHYLARHI